MTMQLPPIPTSFRRLAKSLFAYAEFFERLIPFTTHRVCQDDISTASVETNEAICRRDQDDEARFAEIEKSSLEDIGLIDLADYW